MKNPLPDPIHCLSQEPKIDLLLKLLEKQRGKGRNDYPVRLLWNVVLKSLFSPLTPPLPKETDSPTPFAISRFNARLVDHFDTLQKIQSDLLLKSAFDDPGIGQTLVYGEICLEVGTLKGGTQKDSKKGPDIGERILPPSPNSLHKVEQWFGYRHHFLLDVHSSLPIATKITPASTPSVDVIEELLRSLYLSSPELLKRTRYLIAPSSCDDVLFISKLWDTYGIKPIIELRRQVESHYFKPLSSQKNVVFNECGEVFCIVPGSKERRPMAYAGFEEKRRSLKFRCLSKSYNMDCPCKKQCLLFGSIRIPLETDRRLFTPVARSSYKWANLFASMKIKEAYEERK